MLRALGYGAEGFRILAFGVTGAQTKGFHSNGLKAVLRKAGDWKIAASG